MISKKKKKIRGKVFLCSSKYDILTSEVLRRLMNPLKLMNEILSVYQTVVVFKIIYKD